MVTLQDYLDLADQAEQVRMSVIELNAEADKLGVQTPLTIADLMVFPDTIRAVGAAVTGTRHDEEPQP